MEKMKYSQMIKYIVKITKDIFYDLFISFFILMIGVSYTGLALGFFLDLEETIEQLNGGIEQDLSFFFRLFLVSVFLIHVCVYKWSKKNEVVRKIVKVVEIFYLIVIILELILMGILVFNYI